MLAKRLKVVCILGPTCTGKSDLALWLVPRIGGEVVNADSMQVYRHFDIGSAKPDTAAREQAPHHVVDVAEPDEAFNAARFQKMADQCRPGDIGKGGRSGDSGWDGSLSARALPRPIRRANGRGPEKQAEDPLILRTPFRYTGNSNGMTRHMPAPSALTTG